mmetsp:Transcript_38648/g.53663  ORF Transcript_38648/g.53663 Transcript_38648/m.53663 type:complete len:564 (+) Transcript_38648:49-1740(+)|eukprot:CAMPEP_0196576698 /NCGR_PEP_ID=MMETSP1081-20130531/5895_1 /TAXON_ID=36882 /ORGANISM="Pyramimonas amylifera, Strain CCMP720" /LENGTH=563 /DNA_ID=CAMNT_0041895381 /DNA_START=31 /DNA_END=1722 /DNA_ORIENTATION=+
MFNSKWILLNLFCVLDLVETHARNSINDNVSTKPVEPPPYGSQFILRTPLTIISAPQNATISRVAHLAKSASTSATHDVTSAFNTPGFRASWTQLVSPKIADLSAADILAAIRKEILSCEVVHAFSSTSENPNLQMFQVDDMNLTVARRNHFYPNIRTLYFGGVQNVDKVETGMRWKLEDWAETSLMGFPPFTSHKNISGLPFPVPWPASWEEAYTRPIYSGTNIQRRAFPLPVHFGDVQLVFSRAYINPISILSPSDTGWKTIACIFNISAPHGDGERHQEGDLAKPRWRNTTGDRYNCSAWPYSISAYGLPDAIDHFIVPNIYAYYPRMTVFNLTFSDVLARQYARLLDDDATTFDLTKDPKFESDPFINQMASMYFEVDISGNVLFDEPSVKLVVASYSDLFGSSTGREVQQWAVENGWMLAWALSPNSQRVKSCTWRLLDPMVAFSLRGNIDLSEKEFKSLKQDGASFKTHWKDVEQVIAKAGGKPWNVTFDEHIDLWEGLERSMHSSVARLRVPRSDQCNNEDMCVGVTLGGRCICYRMYPAVSGGLSHDDTSSRQTA